MANYNNLKHNINKEFEEILYNMDSKEFKEYFRQLIKKYYAVLFTFQNNYSKYYEESNKQYDLTIKVVKDLLKFKYNNLDNFEYSERLKQAEEIAFNQMNTIHFLEEHYSDIIYYNAVQELEFINSTLTSLIELYETNPSEELLIVIETTLNKTVDIIKEIEKLPVHDNITDFEEEVTFKKEHNKKASEDISFKIYTVPILSSFLPKSLDNFFNILEKLKTILPEGTVESYEVKLGSSEKVNFYHMLKTSGLTEEEAIKITAFSDNAIKEYNTGSFLYEIINSWS